MNKKGKRDFCTAKLKHVIMSSEVLRPYFCLANTAKLLPDKKLNSKEGLRHYRRRPLIDADTEEDANSDVAAAHDPMSCDLALQGPFSDPMSCDSEPVCDPPRSCDLFPRLEAAFAGQFKTFTSIMNENNARLIDDHFYRIESMLNRPNPSGYNHRNPCQNYLYYQQNKRCRLCPPDSRQFDLNPRNLRVNGTLLNIDHVICKRRLAWFSKNGWSKLCLPEKPLYLGQSVNLSSGTGTPDDVRNLQLICSMCHAAKTDYEITAIQAMNSDIKERSRLTTTQGQPAGDRFWFARYEAVTTDDIFIHPSFFRES